MQGSSGGGPGAAGACIAAAAVQAWGFVRSSWRGGPWGFCRRVLLQGVVAGCCGKSVLSQGRRRAPPGRSPGGG